MHRSGLIDTPFETAFCITTGGRQRRSSHPVTHSDFRAAVFSKAFDFPHRRDLILFSLDPNASDS
jgi:hypothetical protein